jgi:hypothetical protein
MLAIMALVTWLVAALLGLNLFLVWLRGDGARAGRSHLRPTVLFGHIAAALAVPVLLVAHLLGDGPAWLAWTMTAVTLSASLLGAVMYIPWWFRRRRALKARAAARASTVLVAAGATGATTDKGPAARPEPADVLPVERRFSNRVVLAHGLTADLTLALVVLTALKVG